MEPGRADHPPHHRGPFSQISEPQCISNCELRHYLPASYSGRCNGGRGTTDMAHSPTSVREPVFRMPKSMRPPPPPAPPPKRRHSEPGEPVHQRSAPRRLTLCTSSHGLCWRRGVCSRRFGAEEGPRQSLPPPQRLEEPWRQETWPRCVGRTKGHEPNHPRREPTDVDNEGARADNATSFD